MQFTKQLKRLETLIYGYWQERVIPNTCKSCISRSILVSKLSNKVVVCHIFPQNKWLYIMTDIYISRVRIKLFTCNTMIRI